MAKRKTTPSEESAGTAAETTAAAEGYTVLARRYRPQQFADLVGQEPVARALINALESNRVAHAYLFTGARGVGKTSTARILAKALNCVTGPTPTPCGACDQCKSIATGEDVDVLEIDGASNRGIDEVRELRRNVSFRPARGRYKIYIIDEVHMLTKEAFNALLKTLEEPPAHVKFIFATTEVQKIPVTILSRCQRFDFAGIGSARIVERLRAVVAGEGMRADDEALEWIARRAGGSMRDAQSLLDQLLAFGGGGGADSADRGLSIDQVHRLLGTAHEDRVVALAAAVLTHDTQKTLELLEQAAAEGLQLGELLEQLIDYWRDLMVVHVAGPEGRELSVTAKQRDALARQAKAQPLDTILAGLDILATAKARLRGSQHGRIVLEMALVRLSRLDELVPLTQLAQLVSRGGRSETPRAPQRPAAAAAAPARPPAAAPRPAAPLPEGGEKKNVTPEAEPAQATLTPASLPQVWPLVLAQVGPMLAAYLERAAVVIPAPNSLVLRFASQYNTDREHCQEPGRMTRIVEALRKVTGNTWSVRCDSVQGEAAAPPKVEAPRSRRQRAEALQEPLLKRAVEALGAQIVQMDEGFGAVPAEVSDQPPEEEPLEET